MNAYDLMMARAIKDSRGERKRRLQEEHGYLEKRFLENVWWPAVGNLDHLHPEYEIRDFKDGVRYGDYAYLPSPGLGLLLEADGYGPHGRDITRWQFGDGLERQNHIWIEGWKMLRFSRDYILEKPRQCQQTLLAGLAKWAGWLQRGEADLNMYERAILHLAGEYRNNMNFSFIHTTLGINDRTAAKNLRSLVEKKFLKPHISKSGRIMSYSLID
ncbi:DNA-binding response regulator [Cohnella nanjingensis]|uniref:DNA-binding response regulator n=1 Tax=Cohnella nanjingensis TaxID=1387779 RepID=A0A7X0RZ30_9BACL|nr:DNA-binding response regulator [Cohnella nanjingensis]MBB6674970.1 DNA-binding response regulator [Cohnella nanjingensis]